MFTSRLLLLLVVLFFTGCSNLGPSRAVYYAGSLHAPIKGDDIYGETQGVRLDVNANRVLGLPLNYGRLDIGLEIYLTTTFKPRLSVFGGLTPMLRYSYPITSQWSPYVEGGAGPIFLGFSTDEQEDAGFNFFDQIGAGFEFKLGDALRFLVGYRFGHISHAGLRPVKNKGIESHSIILGLAFDLP